MLHEFSGNREDIESSVRVFHSRSPHIIARSPAERLNFLGVDIAFRSAPGGGKPRLDFDKHQHFAFARYQVDLAAALRGTPVARYYDAAGSSEITVSQVFAASAHVTVP